MTSKEIEAQSWKLVRSYLETASPAQWHIFAARSNYDDNEQALRWLIDNSKTDLSTVLMIYWNLGAAWYVQFSSEEECAAEYQKRKYRLLRLIEQRYNSSYYANSEIWFDPNHSDGARPDEYPDIPVKRPIPEIMLQPVNGSEYVDVKSDPDGYDEGLPIPIVEALYALYDEN
jgi:hypothetical protein